MAEEKSAPFFLNSRPFLLGRALSIVWSQFLIKQVHCLPSTSHRFPCILSISSWSSLLPTGSLAGWLAGLFGRPANRLELMITAPILSETNIREIRLTEAAGVPVEFLIWLAVHRQGEPEEGIKPGGVAGGGAGGGSE